MTTTPPPGQERDLAVLGTIASMLTETKSALWAYKVRDQLDFELDEHQMYASLYALLVTGHIEGDYTRSTHPTKYFTKFVVLGLTPKGYHASGLWDASALAPAKPHQVEEDLLAKFDRRLLAMRPGGKLEEVLRTRLGSIRQSPDTSLLPLPDAGDYYERVWANPTSGPTR